MIIHTKTLEAILVRLESIAYGRFVCPHNTQTRVYTTIIFGNNKRVTTFFIIIIIMDKTLQNTFGQLLFSGAFSGDYLFYAQVGSYRMFDIVYYCDIATHRPMVECPIIYDIAICRIDSIQCRIDD